MIQIGVAGSGCLVGGIVIGCYRDATQEFVAGNVAPTCFQNTDPEQPNQYARKAYLAAAVAVVKVCFRELRVQPGETSAVSNDYTLSGVHAWLTQQGYAWQIAQATAPLHDLLMHEFQAYLASLGCAIDHATLTDRAKVGLFWWQQVRWLKHGNVAARTPEPTRAALCKTGWAKFADWAYRPYAESRARKAAAHPGGAR